MDKKTKLILGTLLLGVLIVGIFLIRGLTRIKPGSEIPTEPTPSGPSGNPTEPSTGGEPVTEPSDGSYVDYGTFKLPADFKEITVSNPNMYMFTGYHTAHVKQYGGNISEQTSEEFSQPYYEHFSQDKYKVEGLKTFYGAQVYFATRDDLIEYHHAEDDPTGLEDQYYFFNGNRHNGSNKDGYVYNIGDLHEEGTGMRIYVLEQEYIDLFNKEWEEGQKVLSGELPAEEGMIIVNGRLLENYKFLKDKAGRIFLPMKGVGQAVDINKYREEEDPPTIYIPIRFGSTTHLQAIPYTIAGETNMKTMLTFVPNKYMEFSDGSMMGFSYGLGGSCYCTVNDVAQYTGYHIYTNGTVVVVVSDDVDWNNNFILDTREPLSYEEQMERYGEVTITEDLDDPVVVEWFERDDDE